MRRGWTAGCSNAYSLTQTRLADAMLRPARGVILAMKTQIQSQHRVTRCTRSAASLDLLPKRGFSFRNDRTQRDIIPRSLASRHP